MELQGLDYNTQREKLKLMAYGRDVQQMVEVAISLPTKEERQRCAETIIETMKRVAPSQQSQKERLPVLWYHLALMSDFKLDIDYPVEIVHEDKMSVAPEKIAYNKSKMPIRHYGRLLFSLFEKLKTMPEGAERDALVMIAANQMRRSLISWGMGTYDREKIVSDLARFTDGVIQVDVDDIIFDNSDSTEPDLSSKQKKKKKK